MSPTTVPVATMGPGLRRNMVTICAMTATIMQALDTTIANVALPYMQGTMSASQEEINWVLTSYIIDRKSTRLNSSHRSLSRMPSSA